MVGRVPAQLHVGAVAPGLQPRLRHLQRGLLVPQRLPEPGSHVLLIELETKVHPKVRNHGEGPSRGLFCDYEPSDGPSFQAL